MIIKYKISTMIKEIAKADTLQRYRLSRELMLSVGKMQIETTMQYLGMAKIK